jgi:hypothetical protein
MAQDPLVRREPVSASCNDGRMRVWRHKNTACTPRNIQPPRRAKHHAKRVRRCRSANSGRLMTPWLKSRWFQTVSNCSCWQTSIGQPVLFEYGTGCKNTACTPRNIQPTVPYGGGSVMVWVCISHDCKLDLVTIQGNLTGDQYIRDVLQPVVVPHFDNHPLATRPVYSSCWQTSIGKPVLFEYGTGCEWHPSNQTLQCPVVMIRCHPWSAGSWQVFHIVRLCVFSHQYTFGMVFSTTWLEFLRTWRKIHW